MADVQHDYASWAANKMGGDGAAPAGEQSDETQEEEQKRPAHECVKHAAEEIAEVIESLEEAKGQVDDPDALQKMIDELTVDQQDLTEMAEELEPEEGEEDDEEEDEDGENGKAKADRGCVCGCKNCECGCERGGSCVCGDCEYAKDK